MTDLILLIGIAAACIGSYLIGYGIGKRRAK